jgi:hypothetical protein
LTRGAQFVESLPRKVRFYDRNERRSYELTRAVAARLIDDPTLIGNAVAYTRRHMSGDAHQSRYFAIWQEELRQDVADIVRHLLEDSSRGALLRDTQPVFCVLTAEAREEIIRRSRLGGAVTAA